MTTFNKANQQTNALNTALAWTQNASWPQSSADEAVFDTTITANLTAVSMGASLVWGKFRTNNLNFSVAISNTATPTLTLTPTSYSNVGIDLSNINAAWNTANPIFSIACATSLGSNQTWNTGNARFNDPLLIGGTANLTKTGWGGMVFTAGRAHTFVGTFTISQGSVTSSGTGTPIFGNVANAVVVEDGGTVATGTAVDWSQSSFTITGAGSYTGATAAGAYNPLYGAALLLKAVPSSKTITFTGNSATVTSFTSITSGTHAAKFTGTTTTSVVFSQAGNTTLSNAANDFVAGTRGVELQGYNSSKNADGRYYFIAAGDSADTTFFGNASNAVYIEKTGALQFTPTTTRTFSRNISIEGHSTSTTPASDVFVNAAQRVRFTGTTTLLGTGGFPATFDAATNGVLELAGTLSGAGTLSVVSGATVELATGLTLSSYTGGVTVAGTLKYGIGGITGAASYVASSTIDNLSASTLTLSHSAYTVGTSFTFAGSSGEINTGSGAFSGSSLSIGVTASKLTIPANIVLSSTLAKTGAGTLVLSGTNTITGSLTLSAGTLVLNSAGAAGGVATTFTFGPTGTTIDSTTGVSLTANGAIALGGAGGFTWKGSADLAFGNGAVTHGGSRTVTFVNGATGKLTFNGPLSTTTATYLWDVGGSVAGAKNVLYIANTNASLALTGQVTAGYLRAGNAAGLGAVGTITQWTVSSGAAIELIGSITVPSNKNFSGLGAGAGPNTDGALRAVSGANNRWQGAISFASATGARIQVDAGTFTLDPTGSTAYVGIDGPAIANTAPIVFSAAAGATLNQDRILAAGFSTVTIANGTGTVVLSKANLHSGAMTCSAGTTKLTNINAVGAGAGNNVTVLPGATMESTVKAVFPATLTLGSTGSAATFKVSV